MLSILNPSQIPWLTSVFLSWNVGRQRHELCVLICLVLGIIKPAVDLVGLQ